MKMTVTDIKRILTDSAVDQKKAGVAKVLLDAPANYYSFRAIELIDEATKNPKVFQDNLKKAILFLGVARLKTGGAPTAKKRVIKKRVIKNTKVHASQVVNA